MIFIGNTQCPGEDEVCLAPSDKTAAVVSVCVCVCVCARTRRGCKVCTEQ